MPIDFKTVRFRNNKVANNYSLYNSKEWRSVSLSYRNANPMCVNCKSKGIDTFADVVDHIIPINQGGDVWNESNFQSLCHKCHNTKRQKEKL